jgi:methionyl-tRNA synthetase
MPPDYWRWYLTANSPESADSSFTWDHFQSVVNNDLANVIGNLVNRLISFTQNKLEGVVPQSGTWGPEEHRSAQAMKATLVRVTAAHDSMEFRRAAAETRSLWSIGNEYITHAAPWSSVATDPAKAAASVRHALELCRVCAIASLPIIPASSSLILSALGDDLSSIRWPNADHDSLLATLKTGYPVGRPEILFKKIDQSMLEVFNARFPPPLD